MLDEGGRPDQYRNNLWGGTCLMLAVQLGNLELVMLLLKANADILATDNFGHNAMDWARRRRQPEVSGILLARKARLPHARL
jgi:ankyrin repeat protein